MNKIWDFCKKRGHYILVFLLPWLVLVVHSILRDTWPLGSRSILNGDAFCEIYPFYVELWNKVHQGESLFYSWNAAGGYDFYINMAYFLVSPFTCMILLLPKAWIAGGVQTIMILEWCMTGVTMLYYFEHTRFNSITEHKKTISVLLACIFVFGNFMIFNIISTHWNDVIILFPLILLALEKLVYEGKWKPFYLLLSGAILCNYILAYQLCIFVVLWFLFLWLQKKHVSRKTVMQFIGCAILSGFTATITILPSIVGIMGRKTTEIAEEKNAFIHSCLLSLGDFVQKFFVFDDISDVFSAKPLLYCSMGLVYMILLYLFVKDNASVKYGLLALMGILIGSLFYGGANYVWHGFAIPNGLYNRFVFLLVFVWLFMLMRLMGSLERVPLKAVLLAGGIGILLVICSFFDITQYLNWYVYLASFLLLVFYIIVFLLYKRKSITVKGLIVTLVVVMVGELLANAYYEFSNYATWPLEELQGNGQVLTLLENVELEKGERVSTTQTMENIGMLANQPNGGGFFSYINSWDLNLHSQLGMPASENMYNFCGASPVINILYNNRYGVGVSDVCFLDVTEKDSFGDYKLYEMNRRVGLGYMVKEDVLDWNIWYMPFDVQNDFIAKATGEAPVFKVLTPEITCQTLQAELPVQEEGLPYGIYTYSSVVGTSDANTAFSMVFFSDKDYENLGILLRNEVGCYNYVFVDGEEMYYDRVKKTQETVYLKNIKKGQKIAIVTTPSVGCVGEEFEITYQFAEFQEDVFERAYQKLSKDVLEVEEMEASYIKGTIDVSEEGLMMTSIHAADGFTLYVDGVETGYKVVGNTMMAVPLKEGVHKIEIYYETPYAKIAAVISCGAVLLFIMICGVSYYGRKRKNGKQDMEKVYELEAEQKDLREEE